MGTVYKAKDLAAKVKDIAENYNTVYCWGSFGFPITESNIERLARCYPAIYTLAEKNKLKGLIGKNYFGFDCVGLIKGVLWGFTGDKNKSNGGTVYCSKGVNDIDCNAMFNMCKEKSADFSNIEVGEFLWLQGHIGVYIGGGLAVEATASWENRVQITAVGNIGTVQGYKTRRWTKHGKSPFIDYSDVIVSSASGSANKATYTIGRTNAPVNVRETASIKGKIVTKLAKGVAVKLTGKSVSTGGYAWAEIIYNGKSCWCDGKWINR